MRREKMQVFETTIRLGRREYRVEAVLDDEPKGDSVALEFVGKVREGADGQWQEARLRGTFNLQSGTVGIEVPGDIVDFAADEIMADGIEHIIEVIQGSIKLIPTTDPILGCLIKGAASSVIVHTVRCWYEHQNVVPRMTQVRAIGECLIRNGKHILGTFGLGFGKCLLFQ
jgi:hypothetical protein